MRDESRNEWGLGDWLAGNGSWLTTSLVPLLLVISTPPVAALLWVVMTFYDGSIVLAARSPARELLGHIPEPSWTALAMLLGWLGFQLLLLRGLPGKRHLGPVTPRGNRPTYRLNGIAAFVITHVAWFAATGPLGLFSGAAVYHHFGALLVTSSLLALVLCAWLYVKGLRAPSTSDAGGTGNLLWDFYWGTELHPRLLGVELKQLFNCRFAMMGWSIIVLSYAAAQVELHGHLSTSMAVCVGLQVVYVFKFFLWEGGYFNSLDIMHDRFGFYICWGVCAWLPIVYTIAGLYLVNHPIALSPAVALAITAFGLLAIRVNYAADEQRQRVRATGGETKIWGRKPEIIVATYVPADGQPRQNQLLVSGWWGVARHFHYLPELGLALAWTLPVGTERLLPWFYPMFLAILLVHRSLRDDERCARKYGPAWAEYRRRVRWRMLPGVF
ncbi:7-dehydrocholesterol reductase [Enhygromyxa salina]|uniref:7-dehydrocholesterol reductase n=1 Tax=Enhygromyxa salina TaxID=215803 RepID=UPI0011B21D72|nr:7-dehydrocholesterol reductase [Enhygromyxa salina]